MNLARARIFVLLISSVVGTQSQLPDAPQPQTTVAPEKIECALELEGSTSAICNFRAEDLQDEAEDTGIPSQELSDMPPVGPSVAVIGCGPGGMFFLHALATKRKQLQEANDIEGLKSLPTVTVYEKTSSPGGVWKSDPHCQGNDCTNMYEGLCINGPKEAMEFYDYTFKEHFNGQPQPVYLPRNKVLEYLMARVTKHQDVFDKVMFNTLVTGVEFDEEYEMFEISYIDSATNEETYEYFDKCIWASGLQGHPHVPVEVMDKLGAFKGHVTHSSQMNELFGHDVNGVKSKRILMIGDAYSAEDLTLQVLKLGAKEVYITSRSLSGVAAHMGSWPRDAVKIIYGQVAGVAEDGATIKVDPIDERSPVHDIGNVDIIIFCTGYEGNWDFVDDGLYPDDVKGYWSMDEIKNLGNWSMKQNMLSDLLGHVEPSKWLKSSVGPIVENSYKNRMMDHPNMMFIYESTSWPLLDIDVHAWLCLSHILDNKNIPTKQEMLDENKRDLLEAMDYSFKRYIMDDEFADIWCELPISSWGPNTGEYRQAMRENYFYDLRYLSRTMIAANYPIRIGGVENLNALGKQLQYMSLVSEENRYNLGKNDNDAKNWKTFRDIDPSSFKSIFNGMPSIHFKRRWMDIEWDEYGN